LSWFSDRISVHLTNIGLHHEAISLWLRFSRELGLKQLRLWVRLGLLSHEGWHALHRHLLCWHHCLPIELRRILRLELVKSVHSRHGLAHWVPKPTWHRVKHQGLRSHLIWEELLGELLRLLLLHGGWYLLPKSLTDWWLLLLAWLILDDWHLWSAWSLPLDLSLLILILLILLVQLCLSRRCLGDVALRGRQLLVTLILFHGGFWCQKFALWALEVFLYRLLLILGHFLGLSIRSLRYQSWLASVLWWLCSLYSW